MLHITNITTPEQIQKEIQKIEDELNTSKTLTIYDREALHEEINYLSSFLPREIG